MMPGLRSAPRKPPDRARSASTGLIPHPGYPQSREYRLGAAAKREACPPEPKKGKTGQTRAAIRRDPTGLSRPPCWSLQKSKHSGLRVTPFAMSVRCSFLFERTNSMQFRAPAAQACCGFARDATPSATAMQRHLPQRIAPHCNATCNSDATQPATAVTQSGRTTAVADGTPRSPS
jgi:hypothetical protein